MAWYDFLTSPKALDVAGNIGSALITAGGARDAAAAQERAGQQAASMAEFKPYSVTTGFGTSFFDKEKQQAGYDLDPGLQAFRDTFYQGANKFLGQVQDDPMKAAQDYFNRQQGLLTNTRAAEDIAGRMAGLQSGRIGLGLSGASQGAGAGTGYVNPDQYSRDLARAQIDAQLSAAAMDYGQADIDRAISRGTGLLQTGMGIEEAGMTPLTIGADIGSQQAVSGANAGRNLLGGALSAADTRLASSLGSAGLFQNAAMAAGGMRVNPVTGKTERYPT